MFAWNIKWMIGFLSLCFNFVARLLQFMASYERRWSQISREISRIDLAIAGEGISS